MSLPRVSLAVASPHEINHPQSPIHKIEVLNLKAVGYAALTDPTSLQISIHNTKVPPPHAFPPRDNLVFHLRLPTSTS